MTTRDSLDAFLRPVITEAKAAVPTSAHANRWRGTLALALAACLPYVNTLRNGFVYDDTRQILANPYLRSLRYLTSIFTTSVWSYRGGAGGSSNYYRPAMHLLYFATYHVFGARAWGFHLVSLALHLAVTLLVFTVTRRMFYELSAGTASETTTVKPATVAWVAALLFALHPIHSEAVDWIAAVTELELALFCLLAFWCFVKLPIGGWSARIGLCASFAMALLSKEQAMTLPLLATLYEHGYRPERQQTPGLQKAFRYAPFWLLTGLYLVLRTRALGSFAPVRALKLADYQIAASALALTGHYLAKLVWPAKLCAYYVFHPAWNPLAPEVLAGAASLVLCAALFILLWRTARAASFGIIWIFVTLAPVLNASWMPASVFAERYLYLPSVGFCWVAGWAGARVWTWVRDQGRVWRLAAAGAASALAVLCAARVIARNADWHDDLRLYTRTLALAPDAYYVHNNLGVWYWERGDTTGAEREWMQALSLAPDAEIVLNNLGMLKNSTGQLQEALGYLRRAVALSPSDPEAHRNLGQTYRALGESGLAEAELGTSVALAPLDPRSRRMLGEFYLDQGRLHEAEEQFRRSLDSLPTPEAWWGLGFVYWKRGELTRAEQAFRSAEQLVPSSSRAHFILGIFYAATAKSAEALEEYERGLAIDPGNKQALAAVQELRASGKVANPK
jgi:Flp pilus assembly protein TadD